MIRYSCLMFLKENIFCVCEGRAEEGECKGIPDAQQGQEYDPAGQTATATGLSHVILIARFKC